MADEQPPERDEINGYADELIKKIEESLAKHAEFERLYPLPVEAQVASDRPDAYTHGRWHAGVVNERSASRRNRR